MPEPAKPLWEELHKADVAKSKNEESESMEVDQEATKNRRQCEEKLATIQRSIADRELLGLPPDPELQRLQHDLEEQAAAAPDEAQKPKSEDQEIKSLRKSYEQDHRQANKAEAEHKKAKKLLEDAERQVEDLKVAAALAAKAAEEKQQKSAESLAAYNLATENRQKKATQNKVEAEEKENGPPSPPGVPIVHLPQQDHVQEQGYERLEKENKELRSQIQQLFKRLNPDPKPRAQDGGGGEEAKPDEDEEDEDEESSGLEETEGGKRKQTKEAKGSKQKSKKK